MMFKSTLKSFLILLLLFAISACEEEVPPVNTGSLQLISIRVGDKNLQLEGDNKDMPVNRPIVALFSAALDTANVKQSVTLLNNDNQPITLIFSWLDNFTSFSAMPTENLPEGTQFTLEITDQFKGNNQESFLGLTYQFQTLLAPLQISLLTVEEKNLLGSARVQNVSLSPEIMVEFNKPASSTSLENPNVIRLVDSQGQRAKINWVGSDDNKTWTITIDEPLLDISRHTLTFDNTLKGENNESFELTSKNFYTTFSDEPKFDLIPDEELLTLVQQQTFKYFWDFAHPVSGLARERNSSGDLVTIGGSGFGLMAWIVGAERGFITRPEAVTQFTKALNYLEQADRYHGVWPHWLNGNTGATIPFSTQDDGADLVETSFMIQALLTWKQYLNPSIAEELSLRNRIDQLYAEVEWDWFTKNGENVLYWHWSPNFAWQMNLPIRGWNECMITYFLASASPTHAIDAQVYHQGWARNGGMLNGNSYYEISLPLGEARGGPLFYAHYSFLGLDPRGLSDSYANYFEQNRNHTLINRAHAIVNPLDYVGYSSTLWGFTAGDNPSGYSAHSPTNDVGTIQPTAAISSFPYTPDESMEAIKTFYYKLGDRLWGEYGFYDGIDITRGWVANSFLAIDQGPIIIMIENHRSSLLWDLFMANPEVQTAMDKLDFVKTN